MSLATRVTILAQLVIITIGGRMKCVIHAILDMPFQEIFAFLAMIKIAWTVEARFIIANNAILDTH